MAAARPGLAWVCAAMALIAACRAGDPPAGRESDRTGTEPPPGDDRAREQGERMLDLAAACAEGGEHAERDCDDACELGHSNSCHAAGAARESSGHVDQALGWYRRACDGGSGLGCEALARLTGPGPEADQLDKRARFYLRVHCDQGHAPSCASLERILAADRDN